MKLTKEDYKKMGKDIYDFVAYMYESHPEQLWDGVTLKDKWAFWGDEYYVEAEISCDAIEWRGELRIDCDYVYITKAEFYDEETDDAYPLDVDADEINKNVAA